MYLILSILLTRRRFTADDYIELDKKELERKIRLLTLASLAFKHVGQDLPYAEIVSALQVDPSEVEKWAIDGYLFLLSIYERTLKVFLYLNFLSHPRWPRLR